MTAQHLDVINLPLRGRHLIEASAGTGKTFNITRIYLRCLLEQRLTVQQILVMTFTKAATEEIRGRIAATLRDALTYWQARTLGKPFDSDPVLFPEVVFSYDAYLLPAIEAKHAWPSAARGSRG